jgi:UPF0716 protein FxsA
MILRLFLLMTIVPVLELIVILQIHSGFRSLFGSGYALLLSIGFIVFTGFMGAMLARFQGMRVLAELQRDLAEGRMPAHSLIHGAVVLVGAVLLLTPGYLTDICGLLALLPWSRNVFVGMMEKSIKQQIDSGRVVVWTSMRGGQAPKPRHDVIDV